MGGGGDREREREREREKERESIHTDTHAAIWCCQQTGTLVAIWQVGTILSEKWHSAISHGEKVSILALGKLTFSL